MKNIKYFFLVVILAITFSFNSCTGEVEPLDPALLGQLEVSPDCKVPINLQTIRLSVGTSINLTWEAIGTAVSWEVEYGPKDYVQGSGTKIKVNNTSVTITNLFATNSYDFYVRSVCGADSYGEWSAVATNIGTNPNCANPTEVTAVRSTTNTAEVTVNWVAPTTQSSWEIKYGAAGFNVNTGTNSVVTATKPKIISGLAATSYDFYVRAKCSATENSNWVGPINVAASGLVSTGIVGNYLLTSLTSSNATDINGDGILSNNVLSETVCFNDSFFEVLANNSFSIDSKGVTINNSSGVQTVTCSVNADKTGSWVLTGTVLSLTTTSGTQTQTFDFTYNPSNNTIIGTIQGVLVSKNSLGQFVNTITALTYTYTKQ